MPKLPTAPAERLLPALRRVVLVRGSADRTDGELLAAFIRDRDGDAFATLVRRHGPMVLGVARRVIGDHHTADDAFQAVFIVLARRANAVRPREQVGNWLYGVAYRTAIKARMVLARRRSREKQVDAMPEPARMTPDSWSDLQPVIDAELARLPNKLRAPVVLCDLEGRPQRSVAKQLGLAPATLAARVAAARRLLADRLAKRGITLSGGALAVVLGERASAATVPQGLASSAVRAAEAVASGSTANGFVSAHALHLSEGVMRMMLLSKLKLAAIAVLALATLAGGFGVQQALADEPQPAAVPAKPVSVKSTEPHPDDLFLQRTLKDLTGAAPTKLEYRLFRADPDAKKRSKVIDWLIADDRVRQGMAKKLGIEPERLSLSRGARDTIAIALQPESTPVNRDLAIVQNAIVNRSNAVTTKTAAKWLQQSQYVSPYLNVAQPDPASDIARLYLGAVQEPPVTVNGQLLMVNEPAQAEVVLWYAAQTDPDLEFLRDAVTAVRGTASTPLEERYFTEDKDPKKREKLLDTLLKDPATAKKLGEAWKKKMLEPKAETLRWSSQMRWVPNSNAEGTFLLKQYMVASRPSETELLVDSLIAAKKTDEQILEAVTLASAKRLPTAEEKKATLAVIAIQQDKKAAWVAIAKALAPAK